MRGYIEDMIWKILMFSGIVTVVIVLLVMICSDHRVQSYSIEVPGNGPNSCVIGYKPWSTNATVFCSDDITKVVMVYNAMNLRSEQ
jgi:hypothetical protein